MRRIEVSSHPFLDEKLWPVYVGVMLIMVWLPYMWLIAYICSAILALMVARKYIIQKIIEIAHLSFQQKEHLLFVDDIEDCSMKFKKMDRLITLGIPLSVRLVLKHGLTFEDGERTRFIRWQDEAVFRFTVQAVKRGPTGLEECVMRFKLPFLLGTVFVTDEYVTLPAWTVLPSIRKQLVTESRTLRLGDRLVKHSPLKDPLMIQGSKLYTSDPVKQIDWIATSKTGKLQAKVYQHQNLDTFTLMLDLSGPQGNGLHARYEEMIQQASYLVSYLVKEDCKVELFINRLDANNQLEHLRMGEGRKQLRLALVRLALIHETNHFVASRRFVQIVDRRKHPHAEMIQLNQSQLYGTSVI